jgi:GT2 family glycosyltransferase
LDLSIAIVSVNQGDLLRPCLLALGRGLSGITAEVFVVDNLCEDDTAGITRTCFPEANIIRTRKRHGFARANNLVLRQARGRHLLVLNPDTEVRPGALFTLVQYLDEHPEVGIAGARLLNRDDTLQYTCREFPSARSVLFNWLPGCPERLRERVLRSYLMLDWDHSSARAVDWLMGACLCVRRAAAEQVGFLDEGFRLYYEDIDWCYRMWKSGWEVHYVPDGVVMHHHQRTSTRRLFSRAQWTHIYSVLRFFIKHRLLRL